MVSLGDINFGLGPDTSRLKSAMSDVLAFGRAVSTAAKSQSDGAREAEAAMRRQEAAILSALSSTLKLNDAVRQSGDNTLLRTTTANFNRLTKEMTDGRVTALQFQRAMEDFRATTLRVERSLDGVNTGLAQQAQQQKAAATAARQTEAALITQERILFNASQALVRYNAQLAQMSQHNQRAMTGQFNPTAAMQNLQTAVTAPGATRLDQQRAVQGFTEALTKANMAAKQLSSSGLAGFFQAITQNAMLIAGPLSGVAFRLTLLSSMVEHVGIVATGVTAGVGAMSFAFYELGKAAIDAQKAFQTVDLTLVAVSGSATIAKDDMEFLRGVADRSGSSFITLAGSYSRLEAASKGTFLEGQKTRDIFELMTLTNQKLGRSSSDLEGVLLAIEQIMSKGQVMAQELHLQLGNRLPGAMQIMAEALGVTTGKVNQMMQAGELTIGVLDKFAQAAAKRFHINLGDEITTTAAAEQKATTALLFFNKAMDDSVGFSKAYVAALNTITSSLNSMATNLSMVFGILGAVGGAFLVLAGPAIVGGMITLTTWIGRAAIAMLGLNVAIMANPFGAIASILVRVSAALIGAVAGYEILSRATDTHKNTVDDELRANAEFIASQSKVENTIISLTQKRIAATEAIIKGIQEQKKAATTGGTTTQQFADPMTGFVMGTTAVNDYGGAVGALTETEKKAQDQLKQLNDLLAEQQKLLGDRKDIKELTLQQVNEIKKVNDQIKEMQEKFDALRMPEGFDKQFGLVNAEIAKMKDHLREALERAHLLGDGLGSDVKKQIEDMLASFDKAATNEKMQEFFNKQKVALREVDAQVSNATEKLNQMTMSPGQRRFAEDWAEIQKAVLAATTALEKAGVPAEQIAERVERLRTSLTSMKAREIEERLTIPLKNANDTIRETMMSAQALGMAPGAKEYFQTWVDIGKAVDNYHDTLVKAGVPAQQVAELTEKFAVALTKLKTAELELKNFPSLFKTIGDVIGSNLNSAVDAFVSGIQQGTDKTQILRNVWTAFLGDVMKTMLKLTVVNPMMNALFGQNQPVMGSLMGGAGGLLGGGGLKNPFTMSGGWGMGLPGGGGGLPTSTATANIQAGIANVTGGAGGLPVGGITSGVPGMGGIGSGTDFTFGMNTLRNPDWGLASSGAGSTVGGIPLSTVSAGGLSTSVNDAYAPRFQNMLDWLQSKGTNVTSLGGYNYRNIAGTNTLSQHAYGNAMDVNADQNPTAAWGGGGFSSMPPGTSEAAKSFGLKWGGDWQGKTFDPMHFEVDKTFKDMDKTVQKTTDSLGEVPDVTKDMTTGLTSASSGAEKFATEGILPAQTAMSTYAGSTLTNATEQTAATTAATTTMGASAATTAVEVETLGAASATAATETGLGGTGSAAGLGGGLTALLALRSGGIFSGGRLSRFDAGGIVRRPTYFQMGGAEVGQMGEAGPEAIMPLVRDSSGRLGVRGGGGGDQGAGMSGDIVKQLTDALAGVKPQVNVKNVNAFDSAGFLNHALSSREGEQTLLNFVRQRGGAFKQAIGG